MVKRARVMDSQVNKPRKDDPTPSMIYTVMNIAIETQSGDSQTTTAIPRDRVSHRGVESIPCQS